MQDASLNEFVDRRVVLDTAGPTVYIGVLRSFDAHGYWLTEADVHDRNDGHSTKEEYINHARRLDRGGSQRMNRRRVFVERRAVISISALEDIICVDQESDENVWIDHRHVD